jgi:hypothetical protein
MSLTFFYSEESENNITVTVSQLDKLYRFRYDFKVFCATVMCSNMSHRHSKIPSVVFLITLKRKNGVHFVVALV